MSMMAAIDLAITLQLAADGKPEYQDYKRIMGPSVAAVAAVGGVGGSPAINGNDYNPRSILNFLQRVAMRLKCDSPSLNFDWVSVNGSTCLNANRELLIELIASNSRVDGSK